MLTWFQQNANEIPSGSRFPKVVSEALINRRGVLMRSSCLHQNRFIQFSLARYFSRASRHQAQSLTVLHAPLACCRWYKLHLYYFFFIPFRGRQRRGYCKARRNVFLLSGVDLFGSAPRRAYARKKSVKKTNKTLDITREFVFLKSSSE